MGFLSSVSRWFGFAGATSDRAGLQQNRPAETAVSDTVAIGIDSALQISTVWACVTLYVETISTLEIETFRKSAAGRQKDETSRLSVLLSKSPNARMTAVEFWQSMLLNLMFRGNCYAVLSRDASGEVVSMWPVPADQVEQWVLDDGSLVYRYVLATGDIAVVAEANMLRISRMGNGTVGLSQLDYMRATTTEANNATSHANRTFANAGKPSGVLMMDRTLKKEQRDQIRESFSDIASGPMARLFILEAQTKYEPVSMTPADIQLLETRKFSVEEIGRWFRVPTVMLNAVNMTNYVDILDGWFKTSVRPLIELIEAAIEKRVYTARQRAVMETEFNAESVLRVSADKRFELYAKAAQNGIMTRNEIRAREYMPKIEGADRLTAQSNLMPLDKLGQQTGPVAPDPIQQ